jgi:hypothetical protein
MFARPITPRGAALALPFALLLGLAACGGAGTSDSPTDSPPAVTASADPSPTPVAVDIVEEFVAKAEKASTFISDLSGTVRIGDVRARSPVRSRWSVPTFIP